jgi:hypothetical protein
MWAFLSHILPLKKNSLEIPEKYRYIGVIHKQHYHKKSLKKGG